MEFVAATAYSYIKFKEASQLLCDHFGFAVSLEDETSKILSNGALNIRLKYGDTEQLHLHLDLETDDMSVSSEHLKSIGFRALGEPVQPTMFRHEQPFGGPHGIVVTMYRIYNEDDLDILPELHATLDWEPEVAHLAQILLRQVLIDFRERARLKMVEQAEALALIEGETCVKMKDMVSAFLYTTPDFKQADLRRFLIHSGLTEAYIEELKRNM